MNEVNTAKLIIPMVLKLLYLLHPSFTIAGINCPFPFPEATFDIFSKCTKNPKQRTAAGFYSNQKVLAEALP